MTNDPRQLKLVYEQAVQCQQAWWYGGADGIGRRRDKIMEGCVVDAGKEKVADCRRSGKR